MNWLFKILLFSRLDLILDKVLSLRNHLYVKRIAMITGQKIHFVPQGSGRVFIQGDIKKFKIAPTSHLKSATLIECSGGVQIGEYFHTGKGLTIFSTNHSYENGERIPYGSKNIEKPVVIKDFVWCGANVTIVPGVTVGEGVVIGAGSVVTKNVPNYAVVGGNPARVIKFRNKDRFMKLKTEKKYY